MKDNNNSTIKNSILINFLEIILIYVIIVVNEISIDMNKKKSSKMVRMMVLQGSSDSETTRIKNFIKN